MTGLGPGEECKTLSKPEIPAEVLEQWQGMVDIMASVCSVPAALIMKVVPSELEVLVSANVEGNPYKIGDRALLNTGLYCEKVMKTRDLLVVPNALKDPEWQNNPDIEHGLTCYVGYPLIWPDGEIFGTICVLDRREESAENHISQYVKLFQGNVESFLATLYQITLRHETEAALRDSESKYRQLAETSPDWIWTIDSDGRITYSNPAVNELLGLQASDILSQEIFDFVIPEDRDKCRESFRNCIEDCCGWNKLETRWLNRDGSIRISESSGAAVIDSDSRIIGFTGVDRDITDKKLIERERLDYVTQLEMVAENLPIAVALTDSSTGDDLYRNPVWEKLFGFEDSQFNNVKQWLPLAYPDPDYREWVSLEWDRRLNVAVARKSAMESMETFVTCRDGSVKVIEWGVVAAGRFNVIFALDITQHKDIEKRLRKLNETLEKDAADRSVELASANQRLVREVLDHLRTSSDLQNSQSMMNLIIESAPMGLFVIQGGKYTYVNEPFVKIFGFTDGSDVVGKPVSDSCWAEWPKLIQELMYECALESENCSFVEARRLHTPRGLFHLQVAIKMTELWGAPATVGFVSDVTREVELRAQLNRAQKMEALGSLAGGIAHDFNNILHGIMGFTEMAMNRLPKGSEVSLRLEKALGAVDRAAKLVQHILAFSRETEQEKRPILVGPIVKESLEFIRASVTANIEIRRDINPDLHPVNADPTHVHQIIMNLATNAAHAMKQTGGTFSVELDEVDISRDIPGPVMGLTPGVYQRLRVSDTGPGMTPDLLERIFDPYFTTKKPGEGTGLGLPVINSIVTGYGGTITVESSPGKGSTFDVYLPIIWDEPVSEETHEIPLSGKGNILFVDDETIITQTNKQVLEDLGYDVVTHNDPLAALAMFKQSPEAFDLVITDVSMPKMNGLEFSSNISAIRKNMPIIMMTGYSDLVEKENLADYGVRDLLYKPVRQSIFASTLARALQM